MTNEQLASLIQQGGNDELIPILWSKVERLMYMKADRAYMTYTDRFKQCGVELWDIKQSCYIAFMQAVRGYDSTRECTFASYLSYPFKTMTAKLLGYRTSRKEPLNNCISLETSTSEKDDDMTLGDVIADENAVDVQQLLDTQSVGDIVRDEVAKLSPMRRLIVEMHYFENVPFKDIAEQFTISYQRVIQIRNEAFRTLRYSKMLFKLYAEINGEYHSRGFIQPDQYYLKYLR